MPAQCPVSCKNHYGLDKIISCSYPISLIKLFAILFQNGGSFLVADCHTKSGHTNVVFGSWIRQGTGSYIRTLEYAFKQISKSRRYVEVQRIEFRDTERYVVNCQIQTSSRSMEIRYCMSQQDAEKTLLLVHVKECLSHLASYLTNLDKLLKAEYMPLKKHPQGPRWIKQPLPSLLERTDIPYSAPIISNSAELSIDTSQGASINTSWESDAEFSKRVTVNEIFDPALLKPLVPKRTSHKRCLARIESERKSEPILSDIKCIDSMRPLGRSDGTKVPRMPGRWVRKMRDPSDFMSHPGRLIMVKKYYGNLGGVFLISDLLSVFLRVLGITPFTLLTWVIIVLKAAWNWSVQNAAG